MTTYNVTLERGTCSCDCEECFCERYVSKEVEAYGVAGLDDEEASFIRFYDTDSDLVAAFTTWDVHSVEAE